MVQRIAGRDLIERIPRAATGGYWWAMRPRFFPLLVNGRTGDPALHVDLPMERRALMFDLGDVSRLPPRAALRLSDVFVSHTHVDHFIGFDQLLRLLVGREKQLRLHGPSGFADRVEAKLRAYTWNLAASFRADLVLTVTEMHSRGRGLRTQFRLTRGFAREADEAVALADGVLRAEPSLSVRAAVLEHRTPCLGFALEEPEHVNVWPNRLAAMGLAPGPWLAGLKAALFRRMPDETPIAAMGPGGTRHLPLGVLRERAVSITPGRKLAYVTDAAFTPENRAAIVALARDADILFIEAVFAARDAALAVRRAHLTTAQAGGLAREAGVARVEPFHFSPRYGGAEAAMLAEVEAAFRGA